MGPKLQRWKVTVAAKLQSWKIPMADWKDPVATAQSIVTILALLVGGFWTYRTFIQFRQDRPKLVITHIVHHFPISDHLILLSVEEKLSNVGPVALELTKGEIRIIQVLPLPDGVEQKEKTHDSLADTAEDGKVWPVLKRYPHLWGNHHPFWNFFRKDDHRELIEPGEADSITNYFLISDSKEVVNILSLVGNPTENNRMAWRASTICNLHSEAGIGQTISTEVTLQSK
jgi:hypothetical protein